MWPVRLAVQYVARSSSGSGRRPLKAEITSSNLVRATIWPVRLAVQDAALSRRRSPVRIWYGLPNAQGPERGPFSCASIRSLWFGVSALGPVATRARPARRAAQELAPGSAVAGPVALAVGSCRGCRGPCATFSASLGILRSSRFRKGRICQETPPIGYSPVPRVPLGRGATTSQKPRHKIRGREEHVRG